MSGFELLFAGQLPKLVMFDLETPTPTTICLNS
jgi:hypothetical protein